MLSVIAIALLLILGAIAIAASAGDGNDAEDDDFAIAEGVEPLGEIRAGSVASLVDCTDWNEGSVDRQQATVVDIREQLTSGGTIAGSPSLTDQQAFDLFERACAEEFTSAFRLYKVYYQANAFTNLDPYEYTEDLVE